MTSETEDEREAERREASKRRAGSDASPAEGRRRDERAAEPRAATREQSEESVSENPSGERSDPRGPEEGRAEVGPPIIPTFDQPRDGVSENGGFDDGGDADGSDAIPLDITGHDDRTPPGDDGDSATNDGDSPTDGTDSPTVDGETDDPYPDGVGSPDPEDDEVEPVEVLVGLAEDGEIDPWDIDVVRVTDKFLSAMDEADLRTSGRALFYASVLIRMKSDAMLAPDEPQEPEPWEAAPAEDAPIDAADPFATLESEMDRRLERRRARGMPETLDELVRDLREAERDSWWKRSRTYDTSDSPQGFQRGTQELDYRAADDTRMDDEPTAHEVTGATHGEDVDRIIEDVYDVLREQYDQGREEVLYREVSTAGGSRVETYLGLLFLAHRGRVHLQQDELFGDLWIQDPSTVSGSEEAVAD